MNTEPGYQIYYGPPLKSFMFPDSAVELRNILIKSTAIGTT